MTCPHKRKRSTVIVLEPNHEQAFPVAVISVQCHECGQPFEFAGTIGGDGIVLSEDRRKLRVAIREVGSWRVN